MKLTDQTLACSVNVKNAWNYNSLHPHIFMALCLIMLSEEQLILVVFFLLGDSPAPEFLYADVSEHPVCSIFKGGVIFLVTPPMKMEQTGYSETSAYTIQTPGNHPKERIQHSKHGESLKSRKTLFFPNYVFVSVHLSIHLSFCLSIYLYIYLSIYLPTYLSIFQSCRLTSECFERSPVLWIYGSCFFDI